MLQIPIGSIHPYIHTYIITYIRSILIYVYFLNFLRNFLKQIQYICKDNLPQLNNLWCKSNNKYFFKEEIYFAFSFKKERSLFRCSIRYLHNKTHQMSFCFEKKKTHTPWFIVRHVVDYNVMDAVDAR